MDDIMSKLTSHERKKLRELEQELEIKNELLAELEAKSDEAKDIPGHKQKELEQENLMFKELVENLEGITESEIEQFFSMISHELKTPLVPVQGYVKMLKEGHLGKLEEIQREKLGIIDSNTTRLVNLIQNMLDYQKLATGKMEMYFENNFVGKIIDDAILPLDSEFLEKGIEKSISFKKETKLTCDAKRISQVLGHLVNNSLQSVEPKTGKIWIKFSQEENELNISVMDNGSGIPNDQLEKIFTKFYQVDMSNTRERGGVGLGLSICKLIIEAHKGRIWAESEVDKGTKITITLPKNQLAKPS